jgi:uncharacterized protein (TIGR02145 family)
MNKTKGLFFTASLVLALTLTQSCSGDDGGGGGGDPSSSSGGETQGGGDPSSSSNGGQGGVVQGTPVTYEGETYPTVVIGSQTWFAKNLNYNAEGSLCYDDDPSNCTKYGRLYDWETAKAICPDGWHLPSGAEWDELRNTVRDEGEGSRSYVAKLKATSGWSNSGNGTDNFGFTALPGGEYWGGFSRIFQKVGEEGRWWNSGPGDCRYTWIGDGYGSGSNGEMIDPNGDGDTDTICSSSHSIRCIKDN